jgi:type II secretion system protein C
MKNDSKLVPLVKSITTLLILFIIAKIIAITALFYLPTTTLSKVSYEAKNSYVNIKLDSAFNITKLKREQPKIDPIEAAKKAALEEELSETLHPLTAIKLKGIYYSKQRKFITLQEGNEIKFLEKGEANKGYKLHRIERHKAIFTRSGKQYVVYLDGEDEKSKIAKKSSSKEKKRKRATPVDKNEQSMSSVPRDEIKSYQKDMSKIWRNIGLREHKSGGKTDGFIVTFVKKGSVFAQLGMRKNDILIEANGYKLTSYKDALKIYKQIDTIKTFKLTVLRNNEEKELEYDIY